MRAVSIVSAKQKLGLMWLSVLIAGFFLVWPHAASAQYVENNLIDDNIFLNAASMSQGQIQTFLANRGGYLANYVTYSGRDSANVPASQIIYEASQDYGINPQAIMATLQKEQSLVTATNPAASQLNYAMGYGCPDSSGCSKTYLGFFNQVDNATWQLRLNFERARGNNTWWNSSYSYACGGATSYYSTGLYPGRYVTFYDDYHTAYKAFTINDSATASLYCYTPHVYPGSGAEYYSGSYNFVTAFEQWFGSTQPAVEISSPLQISTVPAGVYSGAPTTASFSMYNNTNTAISIAVAVTVRDASNNNLDYALKTITVPAYGTAVYSDTKAFAAEGTYTFGLTSFVNGVWSNTYPSSSNVDNVRTVTSTMQAIPTVTVAPASNITDMRVGRTAQITFTVTNNSAQPMNIGGIAIAMRDPDNLNADLPLVTPATIAAGATYTYNQQFTPSKVGTYSGFITDTKDGGVTWDNATFPYQATNVSRSISFTVKPNPTLTQGPALSIASPRVGQQVTASFKVKNFGDSTVDAGYIGMAIRDPQNRNVDAGGTDVVAAANTEYTFQATKTFQTPGTYTAWITSYHNGYWDDTSYPVPEDGTVVRKITFTVLQSPTVTASVTSSVASPKVGQSFTLSFNVKNFGSSNVNLGYIGLGGRDPQNRNVDPGVTAVTLTPGQEQTISFTTTANTAGSYKYTIISTNDFNTWGLGPDAESAAISKVLTLNVTN